MIKFPRNSKIIGSPLFVEMPAELKHLRFLYKHGLGGEKMIEKIMVLNKPQRTKLGCRVTGNMKNIVHRRFGLGRHAFKKRATDGHLYGVVKNIW